MKNITKLNKIHKTEEKVTVEEMYNYFETKENPLKLTPKVKTEGLETLLKGGIWQDMKISFYIKELRKESV